MYITGPVPEYTCSKMAIKRPAQKCGPYQREFNMLCTYQKIQQVQHIQAEYQCMNIRA